MIIVNDPFVGGSHLPDIMVIAPVILGGALIGYVATRAHQADIGGMEPGSMPGHSQEIYQEGLIIPPVRLYRARRAAGGHPAPVLANVRTPAERRGDFNAQLAAIRIGERRLTELAERYGAPRLADGLRSDPRLRRAPHAQAARRAAGGRPTAARISSTTTAAATSRCRSSSAWTYPRQARCLDFAGSAPQRRGNINAVAPMTHSAVFFAVKVLTDPTIPVNAGTFRPVDIRIPEGSFLDAQRPAAVCAGNTETTQRVADTVLKVFAQFAPDRIPAASQGTMNLISVGGRDPRNGRAYTYVETIAGGQGGRPMGPGMDGVQCNMTNTMNTPIEALEISYPLRVERYELRDGSGGAGQHRGGNGVDPRAARPRPRGARLTAIRPPHLHALRAAGRQRRQRGAIGRATGRARSRPAGQGLPTLTRARSSSWRPPAAAAGAASRENCRLGRAER